MEPLISLSVQLGSSHMSIVAWPELPVKGLAQRVLSSSGLNIHPDTVELHFDKYVLPSASSLGVALARWRGHVNGDEVVRLKCILQRSPSGKPKGRVDARGSPLHTVRSVAMRAGAALNLAPGRLRLAAAAEAASELCLLPYTFTTWNEAWDHGLMQVAVRLAADLLASKPAAAADVLQACSALLDLPTGLGPRGKLYAGLCSLQLHTCLLAVTHYGGVGTCPSAQVHAAPHAAAATGAAGAAAGSCQDTHSSVQRCGRNLGGVVWASHSHSGAVRGASPGGGCGRGSSGGSDGGPSPGRVSKADRQREAALEAQLRLLDKAAGRVGWVLEQLSCYGSELSIMMEEYSRQQRTHGSEAIAANGLAGAGAGGSSSSSRSSISSTAARSRDLRVQVAEALEPYAAMQLLDAFGRLVGLGGPHAAPPPVMLLPPGTLPSGWECHRSLFHAILELCGQAGLGLPTAHGSHGLPGDMVPGSGPVVQSLGGAGGQGYGPGTADGSHGGGAGIRPAATTTLELPLVARTLDALLQLHAHAHAGCGSGSGAGSGGAGGGVALVNERAGRNGGSGDSDDSSSDSGSDDDDGGSRACPRTPAFSQLPPSLDWLQDVTAVLEAACDVYALAGGCETDTETEGDTPAEPPLPAPPAAAGIVVAPVLLAAALSTAAPTGGDPQPAAMAATVAIPSMAIALSTSSTHPRDDQRGSSSGSFLFENVDPASPPLPPSTPPGSAAGPSAAGRAGAPVPAPSTPSSSSMRQPSRGEDTGASAAGSTASATGCCATAAEEEDEASPSTPASSAATASVGPAPVHTSATPLELPAPDLAPSSPAPAPATPAQTALAGPLPAAAAKSGSAAGASPDSTAAAAAAAAAAATAAASISTRALILDALLRAFQCRCLVEQLLAGGPRSGELCERSVWRHPRLAGCAPAAAYQKQALENLLTPLSYVYEEDDYDAPLLQVCRSDLLGTSMAELMQYEGYSLESEGICISFEDEQAYGDGVLREWLTEVAAAVFDPNAGLFRLCEGDVRALHISPACCQQDNHLELLTFAGRIIGLAMRARVPLGFHLSSALYKLLQHPGKAGRSRLGWSDLAQLEPRVAATCAQIAAAPDVEALSLTFVASCGHLGQAHEVSLLPGGRGEDVAVTAANRRDYLDRLVRFYCTWGCSSEHGGEAAAATGGEAEGGGSGSGWDECALDAVEALGQGLADALVFAEDDALDALAERLRPISAAAFNTRLGGETGRMDVSAWRSHTSAPAFKTDREKAALEAFWSVVEEMEAEEQRRLLQFWTGISHLPAGGFKNLSQQLQLVPARPADDRFDGTGPTSDSGQDASGRAPGQAGSSSGSGSGSGFGLDGSETSSAAVVSRGPSSGGAEASSSAPEAWPSGQAGGQRPGNVGVADVGAAEAEAGAGGLVAGGSEGTAAAGGPQHRDTSGSGMAAAARGSSSSSSSRSSSSDGGSSSNRGGATSGSASGSDAEDQGGGSAAGSSTATSSTATSSSTSSSSSSSSTGMLAPAPPSSDGSSGGAGTSGSNAAGSSSGSGSGSSPAGCSGPVLLAAHTCFFQLRLPLLSETAAMRAAVTESLANLGAFWNE